MLISLIAAVAQNGVIGKGGVLPWKLKDDMKSFVQRTTGHHVIMGRKTYESFGGKPLPRRPNIVVTRNATFRAECRVVHDLETALELALSTGEPEAFVIGGAQIYELALPMADVFYRTRVLTEVEGDILFPIFNEAEWDVRLESAHEVDERNDHPFIIETLRRRRLH